MSDKFILTENSLPYKSEGNEVSSLEYMGAWAQYHMLKMMVAGMIEVGLGGQYYQTFLESKFEEIKEKTFCVEY